MSFSRAFAEDNNEFAIALLQASRGERGNLFCSPFILRTILGMASLGARGETAAQIDKVLRLASSTEANYFGIAEMIQRLNSSGGGKYEMAVAHSLWAQQGASLREEFLARIDRYYGAGVNLVDFRNEAKAARDAINRWVEEKTRRMIREIPGGVHPDDGLVLINAAYFKGLWETPFSPRATRNEAFFLADGGEVEAPLMQCQIEARYAQADDFQVLDLDYQGDDLSMLVLLPDAPGGLRDLEAKLSARLFQKTVSRTKRRKVDVVLPKFKMSWTSGKLIAWLSGLGMPLAFDRASADFSGINGSRPPDPDAFYIADVCQLARVDVNEEGTEAAAVDFVRFLGASLREKPPPPIPIFRCDHPFLFAIVDRYSGSILFLGRMSDPTAAASNGS